MGSLKPGATYVYERANGEVYARESGADPSTRKLVGYEYDPISGHRIDYDKRTSDGRPLIDHMRDDKLWGEIRREAKTNPALQKALDRAILIYRLSKDNPE
jgi:hypothetical protein